MVLVTQSFGKESEYRRAIFTIWSFYAKTNLDASIRTFLFTDKPEFFETYFKDLPVNYFLLTNKKIKEMRGSIDFLHRMKIALIEQSFEASNDDLLYADSDTFFLTDPRPLMNKVSPQIAFMHTLEYSFASLSDMKLPAAKPFYAFLNLINERTFSLASGNPIKIEPQQQSWNAGVMMLHKTHRSFLNDVYKLTEQFYPETQNHASEQYAFSVILQNNTRVQSCESAIYHYWYRVKKQILDLFLATRLNEEWQEASTSRKISEVNRWIEKLPTYLNKHVLTLKDNAIQLFHEQQFYKAYRFAWQAMIRTPTDFKFVKDVMYHTRRFLLNRHE